MSFLAAASRHNDVLSVRSFSFPLCVKGLVFRVTADSVLCYDSVTVFRDTYKPFDQKRKKSRNQAQEWWLLRLLLRFSEQEALNETFRTVVFVCTDLIPRNKAEV